MRNAPREAQASLKEHRESTKRLAHIVEQASPAALRCAAVQSQRVRAPRRMFKLSASPLGLIYHLRAPPLIAPWQQVVRLRSHFSPTGVRHFKWRVLFHAFVWATGVGAWIYEALFGE